MGLFDSNQSGPVLHRNVKFYFKQMKKIHDFVQKLKHIRVTKVKTLYF